MIVLPYQRMKALHLLPAISLLLASCSWLQSPYESADYTPEYMKEDSPLDPPGTSEARAAMRKARVKDGAFATGSEAEVRDGKAYLFHLNPDYSPSTGGRMVNAKTAKIMFCEGTYYFVETNEGKRGYMRESDFVDPFAIDPNAQFLPDGQGILPPVEGAPDANTALPFSSEPAQALPATGGAAPATTPTEYEPLPEA